MVRHDIFRPMKTTQRVNTTKLYAHASGGHED